MVESAVKNISLLDDIINHQRITLWGMIIIKNGGCPKFMLEQQCVMIMKHYVCMKISHQVVKRIFINNDKKSAEGC